MNPLNNDLKFASEKAGRFTESVIREMTRIANAHGAVNLAQGFPDFPAPAEIKKAAKEAIDAEVNQYAITWGAKPLRDAIAWKMGRDYRMNLDPETQITVCCGSTEGMIASLLATVNPGDEVIIFEPFYENYGPDVILCGATPKYIQLHPPDFSIDPDELTKVFTPKTRAIVLNSPNNPTGKVFSKEELQLIADLCRKYDALAITDEIYEHIIYDGVKHLPIWTFPGMEDRTILVNSISKTYSVTGWRVGYVIASPEITKSVRKVHDFLTVGAAAPLQNAAAQALHFDTDYYKDLAQFYLKRRDYLFGALEELGFTCTLPHGAYYIMAGITRFGTKNDVEFAKFLAEKIGVASVPGSSFYRAESTDGAKYIRFCFCKQMETLEKAVDRLRKLQKE